MKALTGEKKQAFERAIFSFNDWRHHGGTEPAVSLGPDARLFKISEVCGLILDVENEKLPDEVFGRLLKIPNTTRRDLITKLGEDRTYHSGAYVLGELIKDQHLRLKR
jgi:hypothetical protein